MAYIVGGVYFRGVFIGGLLKEFFIKGVYIIGNVYERGSIIGVSIIGGCIL